jgi:hypothetical protein
MRPWPCPIFIKTRLLVVYCTWKSRLSRHARLNRNKRITAHTFWIHQWASHPAKSFPSTCHMIIQKLDFSESNHAVGTSEQCVCLLPALLRTDEWSSATRQLVGDAQLPLLALCASCAFELPQIQILPNFIAGRGFSMGSSFTTDQPWNWTDQQEMWWSN